MIIKSQNKICIKVAENKHLYELLRLNKVFFLEDTSFLESTRRPNWSRTYSMNYFNEVVSGSNSLCLIAETREEIIGYITGFISKKSHRRSPKQGILQSVFVQSKYRNQGIGSNLVSHMVYWAKSRGAQIISVSTYISNEKAILFYEKFGFKPRILSLELSVKAVKLIKKKSRA